MRDFRPYFDETTNILNALYKFWLQRNSLTGRLATFSSSHVENTTFSRSFNSLPAEKKSAILRRIEFPVTGFLMNHTINFVFFFTFDRTLF